MRNTIVIILSVFCFLQLKNLHAENTWGLKVGTNYSSFRTDKETELQPGFTFGIMNTRPIYKRIFFSLEFLLNNRKGVLREIVIPRSVNGPFYSVSVWDIGFSIYQIEVPVLLKYDILKYKDARLQLHSGLGLSLALFEKTKITRIYSYDSLEPITDYDAIKTHLDPTSGGGGFFAMLGFGINISSFLIECRYYRAFFDVEPTDAFYIDRELDSFHITLVFQL